MKDVKIIGRVWIEDYGWAGFCPLVSAKKIRETDDNIIYAVKYIRRRLRNAEVDETALRIAE